MGVGCLEPDRSILVWGGLYADEESAFSYINTWYKLDLKTEKWSKLPKMLNSRILYPTLPKMKDKIYVIGGSYDGDWEYFDINEQKWYPLPDYSEILPGDDLQSYAIIKLDN